MKEQNPSSVASAIQHLYPKRNLVDLSFFVSFQCKHGTSLNPANCTTYNYLMSPMTIGLLYP